MDIRREEVRAKPLKLLFRGGLAGFHLERMAALEKSADNGCAVLERREIAGRRKDGSEFPAEVSLSKIEFEGETILSLTVQDVAAHALTEERLRARGA